MSRCVFCAIVAGTEPASLLAEEETCLAFLDLHPVTRGHALVVPRRHAVTLGELPAEVRAALFDLGHRVLEAQRLAGLEAAGTNLLLNDGPAANQTVPHVHLHVVPRAGWDLHRVLWGLATRALGPLQPSEPRAALDTTAARIAARLRPSGR